MSRMIDAILYEGILTKGAVREDAGAVLQRALEGAEVFLIDNVADYFFRTRGHGQWLIKDFPNIAPPFPLYWMEFRWNAQVERHLMTVGEVVGNKPPHACGVLVRSLDVAPGARVPAEWEMNTLDSSGEFFEPGEIRWMSQHAIFIQAAKHLKPAFVGIVNVPVRSDGSHHPKAQFAARYLLNDSLKDNTARVKGMFYLVSYPALLATSFLHCRNVEIRRQENEPKLARKYRRRTGRAPVTFKTLVIDPFHRVLRDAGAEHEHTGLKKALHIVRGHFATYDEKPLFGKVRGTFWVPQHLRGTSAEGVVVKNYAVKTAKGG